MTMTKLTQKDAQKKSASETFLVLKLSRAKGDQDQKAKVYQPGEHLTISGEAKLQLMAMGNITRDLNDIVDESINTNGKKLNLEKLTLPDLQSLAKDLGIQNVEKKKQKELIKEIRSKS